MQRARELATDAKVQQGQRPTLGEVIHTPSSIRAGVRVRQDRHPGGAPAERVLTAGPLWVLGPQPRSLHPH